MKLVLFIIVISLVEAVPYVHGTFEDPEQWLHKTTTLAKKKVTKLHFYFHETGSGKNQTSIIVAKSAISDKSPTSFGLVRMIDNLLTLGPEPTSKPVGRVQGLFGFASLEEYNLLMTMNFAFTHGKYNGSTLAMLGRNSVTQSVREISIVGGTGIFRLAHGIATVKTVWFNVASSNAVLEYDVFVVHY